MGQEEEEAAPVSSAAIVIAGRKDGLNGNYTGQGREGRKKKKKKKKKKKRRRRIGWLDAARYPPRVLPPLNKASRNEWLRSRSLAQPAPIAPSLFLPLPSLHPLLLDVFLASSVSRNWPHVRIPSWWKPRYMIYRIKFSPLRVS